MQSRTVLQSLTRTRPRYLALRLRSQYSTQPPLYAFTIGASFAGKAPIRGQRQRSLETRFPKDSPISGWARDQLSIKKKIESKNPGEDAFFVQEMKDHSGVAFGIADGVGGWNDSGIDPGLFSLSLMYHGARYAKKALAGESDEISDAEEGSGSSTWELTPEQCLRLAYDAVLRDRLVVGGSSTGLIATLNARTGLMKAANLGDSGFMIVRNNTPIHIQEPQTHYFNCPKQLSKFPRGMRQAGMIEDKPDDADVVSISLRHGDIAIAYTDGVSDNVWPAELSAICRVITNQGGTEQEQAQNIADTIVEYSMRCMKRTDKVSPFEVGSRATPYPFFGGKEDDATIVVALVSEAVHNLEPEVPIV